MRRASADRPRDNQFDDLKSVNEKPSQRLRRKREAQTRPLTHQPWRGSHEQDVIPSVAWHTSRHIRAEKKEQAVDPRGIDRAGKHTRFSGVCKKNLPRTAKLTTIPSGRFRPTLNFLMMHESVTTPGQHFIFFIVPFALFAPGQ